MRGTAESIRPPSDGGELGRSRDTEFYCLCDLMRLVASGRLDPTIFGTHRFALGDTMGAYDMFADAASTKALKVVLEGSERAPRLGRSRRGRILTTPCGLRAAIDMRQETI